MTWPREIKHGGKMKLFLLRLVMPKKSAGWVSFSNIDRFIAHPKFAHLYSIDKFVTICHRFKAKAGIFGQSIKFHIAKHYVTESLEPDFLHE